MTMRIDDLRLFLEVAREGSASRAAKRLYMAQQSVSDRISSLEGSLGQKLFDRTTQGMTLTSAGRRLLPYAEQSVAIVDQGYAAARATQSKALTLLVHEAWLDAVEPAVKEIRLGALCDIDVHAGHTDAILEPLLAGEADLVIGPIPRTTEGVTVLPLFADPLVCVVPRNSPLAKRSDVTMADLDGGSFEIRNDVGGPDSFFTTVWATPTGGSAPTEDRWVAAFCPRSLIGQHASGVKVVELPVEGLPPWNIEIQLAFRTADGEGADFRHLTGLVTARYQDPNDVAPA